MSASLLRPLLALLLVFPLLAEAALELSTEAFHEVEVTDKAGKKSLRREVLKKALPGQDVIYVITYRNTGKAPAARVVVSNPLPAELVFLPGSAEGAGARFELSVDGGSSWGDLSRLQVPGADGQPRPARAEDVTHLRWTLEAPVKAGASGRVSYRARLK